MLVYDVRPRKDHSGVELISDALPVGRFGCGEPNAISHAMHSSRSHIRAYDDAGNVIKTGEHACDFKDW
jgi:hypothetical protein